MKGYFSLLVTKFEVFFCPADTEAEPGSETAESSDPSARQITAGEHSCLLLAQADPEDSVMRGQPDEGRAPTRRRVDESSPA